ncbi:MAG TPA: hypothetical protein VF691_22440 [Cytophagaceae bacterium]|jgi:hypothetical protein
MPVVGGAFYGAIEGKASYVENQQMFLNRYGFLEEGFMTFSFSPIRDETGDVAGVFHPLTEQTSKMLNERRTKAIRDLAAHTNKAKKLTKCSHLLRRLWHTMNGICRSPCFIS